MCKERVCEHLCLKHLAVWREWRDRWIGHREEIVSAYQGPPSASGNTAGILSTSRGDSE